MFNVSVLIIFVRNMREVFIPGKNVSLEKLTVSLYN